MSDQQVREIQLGSKQLVFLFMASVVVAVAIFLLGVSVGRGVRSASAEAAPASTDVVVGNTSTPPVEMPPATETTPADFQYHDQLQGTTPPAAAPRAELQSPPQAASSAPPAAVAPEKPAASSARPVSQAPAAKESTPPAAGSGWFVQVNSFRSRENADRQAAQLRSKGYSNAAVAAAAGLYRVRIGPFPERAEANRMAARLSKEEGFKPSVQP